MNAGLDLGMGSMPSMTMMPGMMGAMPGMGSPRFSFWRCEDKGLTIPDVSRTSCDPDTYNNVITASSDL